MITLDGFVAGERLLRDRMLIDDGTPDGSHWSLIRDLLSEVFRASGTVLEMPDKCPDMPESTSSAAQKVTAQLLVFVAEPVAVDCGQEFSFHHD